MERAVDVGCHAEVGPTEACAVEPFAVAQLVGQPGLQLGRLARGGFLHLLGLSPLGPLEPADLAQAPIDRFVERIADLLDHAGIGALGGFARQQRRRREFVLEIFKDDRRVENVGLAVDQRRHFVARAGRGKLAVGPARAQRRRRLDLEVETLLAQRDLDLLGVGRQRMFVEQHQGSSNRTATAALAITAMSLPSGSGTSSPPLTAFTVTMPCGSEARTFSRSTLSGCCTPIVTSTNMPVLELTPSVRSMVSELWCRASCTARRAALV